MRNSVQQSLAGIEEAPAVKLTDLHVVAVKINGGRLTATLEGAFEGECHDLCYLDRRAWADTLRAWALEVEKGKS